MNGIRRPYGVLGQVLGHSYTPVIYRELAGIDYRLFEREPDELESFIRSDVWEGLNVTIPYKRTLVPYMDELSDTARRLGNINTITRLSNGRLRGDNTDYHGFQMLIKTLRFDGAGKEALVFGGSGGAGSTVMAVLADMGMEPIAISRTGGHTYAEIGRHAEAVLAVNCTPIGMFPHCPDTPCSLEDLPHLQAFVDIVYNPARTGLMMEAEQRGISVAGGLYMLVAQAAQAIELYLGEHIESDRIAEVTDRLAASMQNIVLIGMPGCGKTRVGERLAMILGREHVDIDRVVEGRVGMSCASYIETYGEATFREQETRAVSDVAKRSGLVISCGGGVVTVPWNYSLLHQNSYIVMLDRPLEELSHRGRPITARDGIESIAKRRLPVYRAWADRIIASRDSADQTARAIAGELPLML